MSYKGILFFDLDGTLIDSDGHLPEENKLAIAQLKEKGYLPVIATGRSQTEVGTLPQELGITSYILLNGMQLFHDHLLIQEKHLPDETVTALVELAKSRGKELLFYSGKDILASGKNQTLIQGLDYFHLPIPPISPNFYQEHPLDMVVLLNDNPAEDLIFQEAFPELNFFRNSPYSMDVTRKDIDKGRSVQNFIQLLGLENLPSYAFGDGDNDISLLTAVTTGIAMGNAKASLKAVVQKITLSNDQAGIPHALRELGLIE